MKTFILEILCTIMTRAIERVEFNARVTWESEQKKKLKTCGKDVHLNGKSTITGHNKIDVGNNVHIGNNAFIRGEGGLIIGENTHISRNFVLYTFNHNWNGKCLPYDEEMIKKSVSIGRNVWIGMNVCIAPGTEIGEGVIIGMGTTLSGRIPDYAIVAGEPYRVIKNRDIDHYSKLNSSKAYGGVNGKPLQENK